MCTFKIRSHKYVKKELNALSISEIEDGIQNKLLKLNGTSKAALKGAKTILSTTKR